jgi:hypothetical protein
MNPFGSSAMIWDLGILDEETNWKREKVSVKDYALTYKPQKPKTSAEALPFGRVA